MTDEDKQWHRRQHRSTRHSIVLCAWLISMQNLTTMWPAVLLTIMLLLCLVAECVLDSGPKKTPEPKDAP